MKLHVDIRGRVDLDGIGLTPYSTPCLCRRISIARRNCILQNLTTTLHIVCWHPSIRLSVYPSFSPCRWCLAVWQLQHAGAVDGELEDVYVRAERTAQEKRPMAESEIDRGRVLR